MVRGHPERINCYRNSAGANAQIEPKNHGVLEGRWGDAEKG